MKQQQNNCHRGVRAVHFLTALFASCLVLHQAPTWADNHTSGEVKSGEGTKIQKDGHEWLVLFGGDNLDHWRVTRENPGSFKVEDGKIVAHGPRAHLFYNGPEAEDGFKDFHFRAEVYTYPKANAGIFFHTKWQADGWPGMGYEAQVNATQGDRIKTGSIYGVSNIMDNPPHTDEKWFLYEIIIQGNRIVIKVDGKTVTDYTEREQDRRGQRRLSSGTFALQAHDPGSRVYFRNIYARPLKTE